MINYLLLVALPGIRIMLCILSFALTCSGFALFWSGNKKDERKGSMMMVISLFMAVAYVLMPTKSDIIQLKLISSVSDLKLNGLAQKSVDKLNKLLDWKDE